MKKSIKRATMKVTAAAVITSSVLAGTPGIMSMAADNANGQEDKSEVKGKPATVEEAKQNLQDAKEKKEKAAKAKTDAEKALEDAKKEAESASADVDASKEDAQAALDEANQYLGKGKENAAAESASAKAAYDAANESAKSYEAIMNEKKAAYDKAVAAKEASDKLLEQAQETVKVTEKDVTKKASELEDAKKDLEAKTAAVEAAQKELEDAKADVTASEERIADLTEKLNNATQLQADAQKKIDAAQAEVNAAQAEYDKAVADREAYFPEYAAAKEKAEQATADYQNALAEQQKKAADLESAKAALSEAQGLVVDAENGVTEAEKEVKIAEAEQNVVLAQEALDLANSQLSGKKSALDEATANLENASAAKEAKDAEVSKCEQLVSAANEEVTKTQKELDALNADLTSANDEIDALKAKMKELEAKEKEIIQKQENAAAEKEQAENVLKEKQTAYEKAEAAYNEAKAFAEDAQTQFDKGSIGFFEYRGNTAATTVFDKADYKDYTVIGAEDDATNLDNMKATLQWMKKCNDIRVEAGLPELNVSDYFMAIAQYDANAEAYTYDHIYAFDYVRENLAGSSRENFDPFEVWYYEEKDRYEAGNTQAAGHYKNIVNDDINATGYAISHHGKLRQTHVQIFGNMSLSSEGNGDAVTLSEYIDIFNAYYDNLVTKINSAKELEEKLKTAKAELDQAQADVNKATQLLKDLDAEKDANNAEKDDVDVDIIIDENKIAEIESRISDTSDVLSEKKDQAEAAANSLASAKKAAETAASDYEAAKKSYEAAKADVDDINAKITEKSDVLAQKKKDYKALAGKELESYDSETALKHYNDANTKLTDAKSKKAEADDKVLSTTEQLEKAEKAKEEADQVVSEKKAIMDSANKEKDAAYDRTEEEVQKLKDVVADKEELLEKAKATKVSTDETVVSAEKAVADAKAENETFAAVQEAKEDALKTAVRVKADAKDTVANAETAYDDAVKEITPLREAQKAASDAQQAYLEASQALETAEADYKQAKEDCDAKEKRMKEMIEKEDAIKDLTVDDIIAKPISIEEYSYLNTCAEKVKEAREKVAEMETVYAEKKAAVEKADEAYQAAEKELSDAVIAETVAQTEYDEMISEAGKSLKATFDWDGAKDKDGKITAETVKVTNVSNKHGDTFADTTAVITKTLETEPTCTEDGSIVYTATAVIKNADGTEIGTVTDTYTETVKATGHDYGEPVWSDWKEVNGKWTTTATFTCKNDSSHVATPEVTVSGERKDATCTTAGTVTYTASVTLDGKTYTDPTKKVVSGQALGHTYSKPVWSWNTDHTKATATFTCDRCKDVQTVTSTNVDVKEEKATCTADGKKIYTVTLTFEGKEYSDTATETIKATGHAYEEPAWNWEKGKDGSYTVTATSICANDKNHKISEIATVKETVKAATCTEAGSATYTATVTVDGTEYTDTKTEVLPALGHDDAKQTWNWVETEDGSYKATVTFICSKCGKETLVSADVTKVSETAATYEKEGEAVYEAVVTRDGKEYKDTKTIQIAKLVKDSEKDPAVSDGTVSGGTVNGTAKKNSKAAGTTAGHQAEQTVTSSGTPKTGDPAQAGMFMSTAMVGLAGIVAGLKGRFRKKED